MTNYGLKNCKKCGKVYSSPLDVCSNCRKEEEEHFDIIYAYLKEYPSATVEEVAVVTKVPEEQILRFLSEGRLSSSANAFAIHGKCLNCGVTIQRGNYCSKCITTIKLKANEALSQISERKESTKNSVHTLFDHEDE
jgi:uncharacterized OB-fold protein